MKKKIYKKNTRIFTFFLFTVVFVSCFILLKSVLPVSKYMPFSSNELDLSIEVPPDYEVKERFHTITLISKQGEINVSRYGSLYNNLSDHLRFLSEKNNITIDILEKIPSDSYEIYKVKILNANDSEDKNITYFISTNYIIYSFQTDSTELYQDLDAIVKSFRYNP